MIDKDSGGSKPRRTGQAPPRGTAAKKSAQPPRARREAPLAAAARRLAEDEAAARRARPAERPAPPEPEEPPRTPRSDETSTPARSQAWTTTPAPEPVPEPEPEPAPQQAYPPPPASTWATSRPSSSSPPPYPPPPMPGSPPPGEWAATGEPRYSPWWKRVLAALLDGFILSVPFGIIAAAVGANTPLETDPFTGEVTFTFSGVYLATWLLSFILSMAYYVILEGGRGGATVGKMALGIQVRDGSSFGPIGYGRALGRRLVAIVLWWLFILPGLLDVLSPLWDRRRQTWHDKAVRSVVVDKI